MPNAFVATSVRGAAIGGVRHIECTPRLTGAERQAQRKPDAVLRDFLTLDAVRGSVDLPQVSGGTLRALSRRAHIHRDQPGVMSQLNGVRVQRVRGDPHCSLNPKEPHHEVRDPTSPAAGT